VLTFLTFVVIILNIIDLIETKKIIGIGGADGEANIIMRLMYIKFGFIGIISLKIVLITFAISVALATKSLWLMYFITGMYVFVVIYNLWIIRSCNEQVEE